MVSNWQYFVLTMILAGLVLFVILRNLAHRTREAKARARKKAATPWYLFTKFICVESGYRLVLFGVTSPDDETTVDFVVGHPSMPFIQGLREGDIVRFEFQEKPHKCARPIEECAYLNLVRSENRVVEPLEHLVAR